MDVMNASGDRHIVYSTGGWAVDQAIPGMGERNDILEGPSGARGNRGPSWALQEASLL